MDRLKGKTALVTGAASGIGAGIAAMFAAEGANVLLTDLNEAGADVARGLVGRGGRAAFFRQDVTDEAQWAAAIAAASKRSGSLDILVNNAGMTELGDTGSISLEGWRKVIDVNLNAVFLGTQHAIAAMKDTGGSIINMSSIKGVVGDARLSAYSASKGGVRAFTKSAALYCAKMGYRIRVNSIHPGLIETPLFHARLRTYEKPDEARANYVGDYPIGFIGTPEDVGYAAVYLASDESRFVTGSELVIDGGYTAG